MATDRKRQLSVALDQKTRAQLEASAKEQGRSVADEIRRHVETSLSLENKFDSETRWLGVEIMQLAHDVEIASDTPWYQHGLAHTALVEAITAWFDAIKPPPVADEEHWGLDPRTLGRSIANLRLQGALKQVRPQKGKRS